MAGESLKVPIGVPVETNAAEAADSVDTLREQILGSTDAIKAMQGTLRNLRGTTAEVTSAKAALTGKIQQLQGSVSTASLKLVQQGTTYDAAAQKEKKYLDQKKKLIETQKKDDLEKAKDRQTALTGAIAAAGGPVASLKGRYDALKSILGETSGASGKLMLASAGLVAVIAAIVVAAGAGAVALGRFILASANAARTAGLAREAWSGTAANAANLGTQIDALSNKVPTAKAALNDLAIGLMKSKLGGQATVDTFNAVAQASSALGDEAGKKIQDFIERGRLMGRMRIDPREMLEGFGNLQFTDVAGELATQMGIGIEAAKKKLADGSLKLGEGAAAMRKAVEKKFGELNLRKMLDLNVMSEKLHEKLAGLTNGVKLEPLLKPLGELGKLFDESTVTGSMLKKLVTSFGEGMVKGLTAAIPLAKQFFEGLIIKSLKAYIGFLQLRKAARDLFGDREVVKGADVVGAALWLVEAAAVAAGAAVVALGVGVAVMAAPFVLAAKAANLISSAIVGLVGWIKNIDWTATGKFVVDGLVTGLLSGPEAIAKAVKGIAGSIKKTFSSEMKIQSPSRDMFNLAKQVPAGAVGGIEDGTPAVGRAAERMADATKAGASGMGGGGGASRGAAGGGGRAPIIVHINAPGASTETVKAMAEASFLAQLTKALEDANVADGIPVQG